MYRDGEKRELGEIAKGLLSLEGNDMEKCAFRMSW